MKKSNRPDAPPRTEKSNMDAPQEEFIAMKAVPSRPMKAVKKPSQPGKINKRT
jgi:hypothetical protein